MPEKVVEIGLEAGVTECAAKDVEEVRDCAGDKVRVGEAGGDRVRLRTADSRGVRGSRSRGRSRNGDALVRSRVSSSWCLSFGSGSRPLRPLWRGSCQRRGGAAPRALARGRSEAEDGERAVYFVSRCKASPQSFLGGTRRKINGPEPLPSARASGFLATLKGRGRPFLLKERCRGDDTTANARAQGPQCWWSGPKTGAVVRRELPDHSRLDRMGRTGAQIGVQIFGAGPQNTAFDARLAAAPG